MNVLIFGGTGRLGQELKTRLQRDHFVTALTRVDGDLINTSIIWTLVHQHKPDVIINATAKNGLEACKKDPFEAFQVNAAAPAAMAAVAKICGALMIHFSTDYVFSGDPLGLYENTPTKPWGIYGRTKLWGEEAVALCAERYFVFRLSSLYGRDLSGVLQPIKQVQEGAGTPKNPVKVLHQYGSPTSTRMVADAVAHVINNFGRGDWLRLSGVYHLATKTPMGLSKVEFTQYLLMICFGSQPNGGAWNIVEGKLPEPRPIYTELRSDKFEKTFDYLLPTWREALDDMLPLLSKAEKPLTM